MEQRIDLETWYPMATFERLGMAILDVIARGDLGAVRAWGKQTVQPLATPHGGLGFFDGLVELAGGEEVRARFADRAWQGAKATTLVVSWRQPARSARPTRADSPLQ